jgi:DNA polymerase eta
MLASKNTRPPVNTSAQGMHWINGLGGELNVRLRDAREINPGLWPKTLVLGTRTGMSLLPFLHHLSLEPIHEKGKWS